MKYSIALYILGAFSLLFTSCKKFVDIPIPNNALNGPSVFTTDATATATMNGLYVRMMDESYIQGRRGIAMFTGLSSDEFTLAPNYTSLSPALKSYYRNELTSQNDADTWRTYYNYLQTVNSVIEGLSKSGSSISEAVKKQLEGEAKFLRAFFYFYLVNLYGEIPLVLTSDWRINSTVPKAVKTEVWSQIVKDLVEAQGLLSDKYLKGDAKSAYAVGSEERVRPTKWSATALLARAYLYKGDWSNAESQATMLIGNSNYFQLLPDLNDVFLKNSKEAIWQLMPVNPDFSTLEASVFIIPFFGVGNNSPVFLSSFMLNSFEPNDNRGKNGNWINSITVSGKIYHYPFKYKVRNLVVNPVATEYFTLFRLGEQYLIRAEARAHQNKIIEAQVDLNTVRRRAGLNDTTIQDKNLLLGAILHERQVEMFSELGHRWFDLKRTKNIGAVMTLVTPQKAPGTQWQDYKQYWPLFYRDLVLNPMLTQTTGY